jgi:hypothetical protein
MQTPQNQSLERTLGELRLMGWQVASHHEFERHKQLRTLWLFTHPCGHWIKAEGAAASEVLVLQLALGDALDHHCDVQTADVLRKTNQEI